jgi:hypothetical protein
MSVHSISIKNLINRVREVFPDVQENYAINLINDALVELGSYETKIAHGKVSTVADQMWYDLSDGATDSSGNKLELNKVDKVYLMDSEGDYIQIPRLTDTNLLLTDVTSESALDTPD